MGHEDEHEEAMNAEYFGNLKHGGDDEAKAAASEAGKAESEAAAGEQYDLEELIRKCSSPFAIKGLV